MFTCVEKAQAVVSMGDFSCPKTCWKHNRLECKQKTYFLRQMNGELSRGDVLLNLLLKNKEELVKDIKGKGFLPCSNHDTVELKIL